MERRRGRVEETRPARLSKAHNICDNELYDLSNDLGESKDLAKGKPELVKALAEKFPRWHESVKNDPTHGISARAAR